MLSFAAICPHPPLLIPDIGKEDTLKIQSTVEAMQELSQAIAEKEVDTIVIISPHGTVFMDFMSGNLAENLIGDFSDFGSDLKMKFRNDTELVLYLKNLADTNNLPLQTVSEPLDHGTMVPLYFLTNRLPEAKVCQLSFSYLDYGQHFSFGEIIYETIQDSEKRIALIASGDLSHKLTLDSPAGYSPQGKKFDELLISSLKKNEIEKILDMDSELIEDAGECGLRSIIMLLGALSHTEYRFRELSYESPFGVGYLVGLFEI